jgi:dihydrofolate reductase
MIYSHVVACAENGTIGRNGQLPWHLPDDLRRFKRLTDGHVLIMGRKTYDSIGRPLPGRFTIVVSRQDLVLPRNVSLVHSLEEAYQLAESLAPHWGEEVFIIGGGEIYRQSLDKVERIYLTRVHQKSEGDTTYPDPSERDFVVADEESVQGPLPFTVFRYQRRWPH